MKILFVIQRAAQFHYYRSIVEAFSRRGHDVRMFFDKRRSRDVNLSRFEKVKKEIPRFSYDAVESRKDFWRYILFPAREIRSYRNYLFMDAQSDFYRLRWARYTRRWLRPFLQNRYSIVNRVVASAFVGWALQQIENITPPDSRIVDNIKMYDPDAIIVSPGNMRNSPADIEYAKAGRALGIPTALVVVSWDNLTTKGIIHIVPDRVLAWNDAHADEAVRYHRIPEKNVRIIGAPFFDQWFSLLRPSVSRGAFCAQFGFDASHPFLLYLGSSKNIAKDEVWLIQKLRALLDSANDIRLQKMNILVRPHPANTAVYQNIEAEGIKVQKAGLPETQSARDAFYDAMHYAKAAVGINTSGMIDAIINGLPVISYMTDYYARTQSQVKHFLHMAEADALSCVANDEEFIAALTPLLNNEDVHKEDRVSFMNRFIRPHGLEQSAAEKAADEIEALVAQKKKNTYA
ncbi:MAG: hypothetical protein HY445_02140 [Candidatus Niyogibacteria bacterium]|nr:hypothetical protein [Candidatus Niyogibacteria bacterium]